MRDSRSVNFAYFTLGALVLGMALAGCESKEEPGTELSSTGKSTPYANDLCPITKTPIPPGPVPDERMRVYKGKVVVFCCPSCVEKWDHLSDKEKEAALAAVAVGRKGSKLKEEPVP